VLRLVTFVQPQTSSGTWLMLVLRACLSSVLTSHLRNPLATMRLLSTVTLTLHTFEGDPPSYAILSHRWGQHEVLFQDLENGTAKTKAGYYKIQMTCATAAKAGIRWAWIDTCCINKSDSAELSEAINSMYRWYEESTVCYVYLADLPSTWRPVTPAKFVDISEHGRNMAWRMGCELEDSQQWNEFQFSQWFNRGWTLQELLAPHAVVFLNEDWHEVGTKLSLWEHITARTRIPGVILHGKDIHTASVAQRMSWAADRVTTRIEDRAYSLMGLFGVNMPLLYGERYNAFLRLQEEIIKIFPRDHTILAWDPQTDKDYADYDGSLLATSPEVFRYAWSVTCASATSGEQAWTTNIITTSSQGIHLTVPVIHDPVGAITLAYLPCARNRPVVLFLKWVGDVYKRQLFSNSAQTFGRLHVLPNSAASTSFCAYQSRRMQPGPPILSRLAASGQATAISVLLDKGISPLVRKKMCRDALLQAAESQVGHAVQILLQDGIEDKDRAEVSKLILEQLVRSGNQFGTRTLVRNIQGLSSEARDSLIYSTLTKTAEIKTAEDALGERMWLAVQELVISLEGRYFTLACEHLKQVYASERWIGKRAFVEEIIRSRSASGR